jgi:hypothetical protein
VETVATLADFGLALVGGLCAMSSFGSAYGGHLYLLVGLAGLVIGSGIAYLGTRWRQPVPLIVVEVVAAYFLLGGPLAIRAASSSGTLPGPSSFHQLASMSVTGWADLLSTAPVVGDTGNLLVIPLLCGLIAGAATMLLARLLRASWPALLPPGALLAVGILFGTAATPSHLVSGGALALVMLAWTTFRARAERVQGIGSASRRGPWRAAAVLVVATALGVLIAPSVPGAGAHLRYVLRNHVALPFDIQNYPSPLAAYRHYVLKSGLRTTPLFKVSGVPAGTTLRIATLDSYNGVVFTVAGGAPGSAASGDFTTVGDPVSVPSCLPEAPCRTARITVTDLHYDNVWMPDVGTVEQVQFHGSKAQTERDAFRYNVATNGALLTSGLQPGQGYTMTVEVPQLPPASHLSTSQAAPVALPAPVNAPHVAQQKAVALSAGASSDFERALQLSQKLSGQGAYSDGTDTEAPSLAGHGEFRLEQFLGLPQPVGDAEQYAASMDLMARDLGLPARIVLGAKLPAGTTTVVGADITAWVEIKFADVGWYPFFPTPPTTATVRAVPPPPPPTNSNQAQYQAPPPSPGASGSVGSNAITRPAPRRTHHSPLADLLRTLLPILGWLLLALVVLGGPPFVMVRIKSRRRRRRRFAALARDRVTGGWDEVIDHVVDLGRPVFPTATRRELALALGGSVIPVAQQADLDTFGPVEPDEDAAEAFWKLVDHSLADMDRDLGLWARIRLTLNPASLLRHRHRDDPRAVAHPVDPDSGGLVATIRKKVGR